MYDNDKILKLCYAPNVFLQHYKYLQNNKFMIKL